MAGNPAAIAFRLACSTRVKDDARKIRQCLLRERDRTSAKILQGLSSFHVRPYTPAAQACQTSHHQQTHRERHSHLQCCFESRRRTRRSKKPLQQRKMNARKTCVNCRMQARNAIKRNRSSGSGSSKRQLQPRTGCNSTLHALVTLTRHCPFKEHANSPVAVVPADAQDDGALRT
jgi:hypothetical protein